MTNQNAKFNLNYTTNADESVKGALRQAQGERGAKSKIKNQSDR